MGKRIILFYIIFLQLVRLASSMSDFDMPDCRTSLDFSSAVTLVSNSLRAQIDPVKTLMQASTRIATAGAPCPAAPQRHTQCPSEIIVTMPVAPELVKTNTPLWPVAGGMLLVSLFVCLILACLHEGIVLCCIRHLFSRAREGICDCFHSPFAQTTSPLI